MKKNILNLGKALNKAEQKEINGGLRVVCYPGTDPICCGTSPWQCGVGPYSGGYAKYLGGSLYCQCV